ncbi:MAG TPA: hypothetical protein VGQ87_04125 [Patescibacteria group bacterium]|jgi:hypothetical protein|nr:hypothetical protein [Patescibacteria group bacterium]
MNRASIFIVITLIAGLGIASYGHHQNLVHHALPASDLDGCYNDISRCLNKTIPDILLNHPLKEVMGLLAQNQDDKNFFLMCHEYRITRQIGFVAAQKSNDFKTTINSCNGLCYEGCYHGVTESFMAKLMPADKQKALALCGSSNDYDSNNKFLACLYGIGRGLIQNSKDGLPAVLALCQAYAKDIEKEGCQSGVFAEAVVDSPTCAAVDSKYGKICYAFAGRHYLDSVNGNFGKAIDFCLGIPNGYQDECVRQVSGHLVYTQTPEKLNNNCNQLKDDFKKICINSVADYLIQRDGQLDNANLFCSLVSMEYKNECTSRLKPN